MREARETSRAKGAGSGTRRRLLIALPVVVLLGVSAVGVSFLFQDDPRPVALPGPSADGPCAAAEIGPDSPKGPEEWRKLSLPAERSCFSLTATKEDGAGVARDSEFVLSASGGKALDADAARRRLEVEPTLPLHIRSDGSRLRITPEKPMTEDTVYRFTLLDRPEGRALERWSFQSETPLRVVQNLPADQATGVPLDTGIEVVFSHDGVTGAEDLLEIEPPVDGRFETHKRTLVFVPKALRPATLYAVTLRAGAEVADSRLAIDRDFTFRFETGTSERDGRGRIPGVVFRRPVWESPTEEPPVLGLFTPEGNRPDALPFEVYHFPGANEFLSSLDGLGAIPSWAILARDSFAASPEGLDRVAQFQARLEKAGPSGELFVRFPEALPSGYYLVQTEAGGDKAQTWLQVTDLAPYASVSERRTLVWVNDVRAHAPVKGATIKVAGPPAGGGGQAPPAGGSQTHFSTTTGPDGVALFDTPTSLLRLRPDALGERAEHAGNLVVTAGGGRSAVIPLGGVLSGAASFQFREFDFFGDPGRYWRYLYTDRTLYRPTDTVNVWGLVQPRAGSLGASDVDLEITGNDEEGRTLRVGRVTLSIADSGTFIGKLPLEGVSPGYYTLTARIKDQTVASTSLEVRDFVSPAYSIDVVPSARAAFAGDDVRYDIKARFFEGTPVPAARLRASTPVGEPAEVTTDSAGAASLTFKAGAGREIYGIYNYDSLSVTPAVAEEGEIFGGAEVRVFAAGVDLQSKSERRGETGVVSGVAYAVDLARAGASETGAPDDHRGAPLGGRRVVADVAESSYQRIETGEYYDFIAKEVRKSYRYDPVKTPLGTFTATTDGSGRFEVSFPAPADRTYQITLTTQDDAGRTFKIEEYLSSSFEFPDFTQLAAISEPPYKVGAEVSVAMRQGGQTDLPAGGDNRYLFLKAAQGIRSYVIQDGPRFTFSFAEADVPSVAVRGVRFTGSTYDEALDELLATFDPESRRLDVEIRAEKPRYRPGEKARLDVSVRDPAGRPVEAEVLLSAVDERIFRLQGQGYLDRVDLLDELYLPVRSGLVGGYSSHQRPGASDGGGGAEAGEGGEARSDFRDSALFRSLPTNGDGKASAEFELPDSLTSWRVSALVVTPDRRGGSGLALVPVGLPVFADVATNDSYLEADRPVLRLRAFGDALSAGDPVEFSVESKTFLTRPVKATGVAFDPVDVALPLLRGGRHDLTVRVSAKGQTDALTRKLSVVKSRLVRSQANAAEVDAGGGYKLPADAAAGLVRLVLSDHNRGRWYPDLVRLAYTSGDRVDQALARQLAQELLSRYFDEGAALPGAFRGSAYQTEDGGIAILPFADDDLVVTARVAALAPDRFGRQGLVRYLRGVYENPEETDERALVALYGLAAAGEPVLVDVQRAAATTTDVSPRERLYAGLGAAALGDLETARRLYRGLLGEFGESRAAAVRLNVGEDQDDVLEATSLAAILGAQLADRFAPALETYLGDNRTTDLLVELERISFLSAVLPRLSAAPVRYSYRLGSEVVEERLERGEAKVLEFAPRTAGSFELEVAEGTLGVLRSALVPYDESAAPDPDLSLSRELPEQIARDSLVKVTLRPRLGPKAVDGCHRVADLLPSGLRVVSAPYRVGIEDRDLTYPYAVEGQRVSFCAYKGSNRPLVYYARVVSAGSYVAEPATIQARRGSERVTLTGAGRVEIR